MEECINITLLIYKEVPIINYYNWIYYFNKNNIPKI